MKTFKKITIAALGIACLMSFQNCGSSKLQFEDLELASTQKFFSYPYSEKTQFYQTMMLEVPTDATAPYTQLKFVGAAAYYANPSASISYVVRVQTMDGQSVCATQTGTLATGTSSFTFDCTPSPSTSHFHVEMDLRVGSMQVTYTKDY